MLFVVFIRNDWMFCFSFFTRMFEIPNRCRALFSFVSWRWRCHCCCWYTLHPFNIFLIFVFAERKNVKSKTMSNFSFIPYSLCKLWIPHVVRIPFTLLPHMHRPLYINVCYICWFGSVLALSTRWGRKFVTTEFPSKSVVCACVFCSWTSCCRGTFTSNLIAVCIFGFLIHGNAIVVNRTEQNRTFI